MSLPLPVAEKPAIFERTESEEAFENARVDQVELTLQFVQKFVQSAGDDLLDRRISELALHAAEVPLGRVAERSRRRAGYRMERGAGLSETVINRARELEIEEKEVEDVVRLDVAVALAVHLERARRSENGRPLDIVERRADIGGGRQQDEIFDVEQ